jgi:hypothetical protein
VFAVVQDEQHLPVPQVFGEDRHRCPGPGLGDMQCIDHCLREPRRIPQGGEARWHRPLDPHP